MEFWNLDFSFSGKSFSEIEFFLFFFYFFFGIFANTPNKYYCMNSTTQREVEVRQSVRGRCLLCDMAGLDMGGAYIENER